MTASETPNLQQPTKQEVAAPEEANQFQQLLIETNWAQEWKSVQQGRKRADSAERWDKRSATFSKSLKPSPYVLQFLDLLELQPGDTIFDMGCGTGALAIPLAQAEYKVIARDFSEGMLQQLALAAESTGTTQNIDWAQMSWEDDWAAAGFEAGCVDVALASRSVITQDLGDSLRKLSQMARCYACATISTGYTPMMSPTILSELGIKNVPARDLVYTFNVLLQLGYLPEVSYINTDRVFTFNTVEEGVAILTEQLEHARDYCSEEALAQAAKKAPGWIEAHMEPNPTAGKVTRSGEVEGAFRIFMEGDIRWAFVKWSVN